MSRKRFEAYREKKKQRVTEQSGFCNFFLICCRRNSLLGDYGEHAVISYDYCTLAIIRGA